MPNNRRRERLNSLITQILSELLQREMRDPRVGGMVSIAAVDVTADVSQAKVYVSIMGSEEERESTMRALEHAAGFLRTRLGEELTIRHVPELLFFLDRSIERGDRVLALLNQINSSEPPPPVPVAPVPAKRVLLKRAPTKKAQPKLAPVRRPR